MQFFLSLFFFTACEKEEKEPNYRELNTMLTEVNVFPGLSGMANEENLISFGALVTIGGDWGERGSKEAVEAVLNRYFGVEKIYHERSSLYRSWPGWDVDYPIDGVGRIGSDWANVTNLRDVGNGTFVANVDLYFSFGAHWDDSWLESVSQWKLKNGAKIINTDKDALWGEVEWDDDSGDIYRYETCLITLKPFVYNGKDTWQIISINGIDVPKILFSQ